MYAVRDFGMWGRSVVCLAGHHLSCVSSKVNLHVQMFVI